PSSCTLVARRRTASASWKLSSRSEDGPGAIGGRAGVAARVDRKPAVVAGRPAAGQHLLGLVGEIPDLLGGDPEAGRGGVRALLLDLPGDDDELPLALVEAEPELADGPVGLAHDRSRGGVGGGGLGSQLLGLQQLAGARQETLD